MSTINELLNSIEIVYNRKNNIKQLVNILHMMHKSNYIILNNIKLKQNVINVLESAFNEMNHANMYNLKEGRDGMDWWNFPWDLLSNLPQYTITYEDMENILKNVIVRKEINSGNYVRYSEKLKDVVLQLNVNIMNEHGGSARVLKIIYCIRNFLSAALSCKLKEDVENLKIAANKLLSIDERKLSGDYVRSDGLDINKHKEIRNKINGLNNLKKLVKINI